MTAQEITFTQPAASKALQVMFRKFGGSSFKPMTNVALIADEIISNVEKGVKQVVFSSAPGGLTDTFKQMASEFTDLALSPALDGLTMSSDLIGAQLLQQALLAKGQTVKILDGRENGILTDGNTGGAAVTSVNADKLFAILSEVDICVLPGGQGHSEQGVWHWLGKNSSDLSCVLLAIAGGAKSCAIHSDVDSVYSADPNVISEATPYAQIDYDTIITAARLGAKVLHPNAVLSAQQHGVEILCKLNKPPFATGTAIGHYEPATIIATDKKAQLLTVDKANVATVMQQLAQMNVMAYSGSDLDILASGQVFIPMAYSDYGLFLQDKNPDIKLTVTPVYAVHVVSGTQVLQSRFVEPEQLADTASAMHRDYVK